MRSNMVAIRLSIALGAPAFLPGITVLTIVYLLALYFAVARRVADRVLSTERPAFGIDGRAGERRVPVVFALIVFLFPRRSRASSRSCWVSCSSSAAS
ncbi:MAG: hypothetical protein ACLSVD_15555 [Eggerthellaceae bacterium]